MKDSRTSTRLRRSIGGLAVAGGVAALALSAAPALAAPAASSITGPLTINGSVHGAAAVANVVKVPLVYRGVVATSGVLDLGNGNDTTHTLKTKAGDLVVTQTAKPQQSRPRTPRTAISPSPRISSSSWTGPSPLAASPAQPARARRRSTSRARCPATRQGRRKASATSRPTTRPRRRRRRPSRPRQ